MKTRILATLLAAVLLLGAAGCGTMGHSRGLRIVTTIFPIYDWVRAVLGEESEAELVWLMDGGVDLHSYQATAEDLAMISGCDVFICVGGASDAWADAALAQAKNKNMVVVKLMDVLGGSVRLEELTEGMEADGDGEPEYDEHIWLSVENARVVTAYLAALLGGIDEKHAQTYLDNAAAYDDALMLLDASYLSAVREADTKTLVFGDRYPFRYLADDYGLRCYAAFPGCSAETEASFETVLFLAEKVDELGLPAVMALEGSDHRIAQTVADTADSDPVVLTLDSMQSVTAADAAGGVTYLTVMEENLAVLRQALTLG